MLGVVYRPASLSLLQTYHLLFLSLPLLLLYFLSTTITSILAASLTVASEKCRSAMMPCTLSVGLKFASWQLSLLLTALRRLFFIIVSFLYSVDNGAWMSCRLEISISRYSMLVFPTYFEINEVRKAGFHSRRSFLTCYSAWKLSLVFKPSSGSSRSSFRNKLK